MLLRDVLGVKVMMGRDVLELECSRLSDVVLSRMNGSNKLWELLEEEWLKQVFVVETS
ncbi:hypothetical protein A2U01_0096840, partial [Trifolium medium]|nr:hypothetical protein [Trifolium medium]